MFIMKKNEHNPKQCKRCNVKKENLDFKRQNNGNRCKICITCQSDIAKKKDRNRSFTIIGTSYDTVRRGKSHSNYLIYAAKDAKKRAKRKRISYDIDIDYLLSLFSKQNGKCAMSNKSMTWITGNGRHSNYSNISIDRIDSNLGYTKGNVQLVCYIVNLMKNKLTTEELKFWCKAVTETSYGENTSLFEE